MLPSVVRRVDRGRRLCMSDGWVVITPLWPAPRSLTYNDLSDKAKQAITDAAGSGIEINF